MQNLLRCELTARLLRDFSGEHDTRLVLGEGFCADPANAPTDWFLAGYVAPDNRAAYIEWVISPGTQ